MAGDPFDHAIKGSPAEDGSVAIFDPIWEMRVELLVGGWVFERV